MNNLCLQDNSIHIRRRLRRRFYRKTEWVREICLQREEFGEFHRIIKYLYTDHILFCGYVRMKKEIIFEYILNSIRLKLTKYSNFRNAIESF